MQTDDAELVRWTLAGDTGAFDELVRRYQGATYALAYHHVGRFADAQDIAQQALTKAFLNLRQLGDPARFAAWLRAVTVNECRMWRRGSRETLPLEQSEEMLPPAASAAEEWERRDRCAAVREALQALPEGSRLVVSLHYLAGMPYQEIAAFLGVPLTTVEGRAHRARRQLREAMMGRIEEGLSEHALPPQFTRQVMEGLTHAPGGWVTISTGEGAHTLILGSPDPARREPLVAVTMLPGDTGAIVPGMYPNNKAAQAKAHALDTAGEVLSAFGIRLDEVALCLDGERRLRARATFRKGRATRVLDLRASDALGLAVRAGAPIRGEEDVIRAGKVGEEGLEPALEGSLDALAEETRRNRPGILLEARGFDLGLAPEEGLDTVRYRKDEGAGTLLVEVVGSGQPPLSLDLADHRSAAEFLWDLARNQPEHSGLLHDGREYRTRFSLQDDELEVTFRPAA